MDADLKNRRCNVQFYDNSFTFYNRMVAEVGGRWSVCAVYAVAVADLKTAAATAVL